MKNSARATLERLELPYWSEEDSKWVFREEEKALHPRLGVGLLWCSLQKKLGVAKKDIKFMAISLGLPKQTLEKNIH